MSNLRDLNGENNPLMGFFNALAGQGQDHPLFAAYNPEARDRGSPPEYDDPPHGVPDEKAGPPPPSGQAAPPPPPPPQDPRPRANDPFDGHGFPFAGPFGGRGGPGWAPHGRHGGPHAHGHRGGWGSRGGGRCGGRRGRWNNETGGFDMSKLGEFISQFAPGFVPETSNTKDSSREAKDFKPPVDIFDTKEAFIVHVSLPGAKKEDVGANWDADKSELNFAGVIYRPADEETLKTLALDERDVGAFERKVALGTKLDPAQVDSDGISAKLEDGILVVTIPKLEQDFVEVKKVDIE